MYELLWVRSSRSCCYRRTLPPTKTSVRRRVVGRLHWSLRRGSCAIISPGISHPRWRLQPAVDERSPRAHGSHAFSSPADPRRYILDQSLVSWPKYSKVHVLASLVSSDHKAITVCTVAQNCCNGRSKKYRKWHVLGCSLSETPQRIDIKFGSDDYVGDGSQYAKWHISRLRDVISVKGWNVNGLCFFKFFFNF